MLRVSCKCRLLLKQQGLIKIIHKFFPQAQCRFRSFLWGLILRLGKVKAFLLYTFFQKSQDHQLGYDEILPVKFLALTSRMYFFSKGTFKIRKNYLPLFPMNFLTSEYSWTVAFDDNKIYIKHCAVGPFLTMSVEFLKHIRSGLIVNID